MAAAHVTQQVEVGPGECAVAANVGQDVAGAPFGVQPREGLEQFAAIFGPAPGGQRCATDVQADRDPIPVVGDDLCAPFGLFQGGGPDVDPPASGRQGRVQRCVVADPAAHFDIDIEFADDARQQFSVAPRPNAASRSTRWIHCAPCSCQVKAADSGSP